VRCTKIGQCTGALRCGAQKSVSAPVHGAVRCTKFGNAPVRTEVHQQEIEKMSSSQVKEGELEGASDMNK